MGAHSVVEENGYFYRRAIVTTVAGSIALTGFGGLVESTPAQADTILDDIAQCESSGNPSASNGTHFGLFQFDLSTWRSVGGTGNPADATITEQYTRAQALYESRGTQPWLASEPCWAKKPVPTVIHDQLVAEMSAPQTQTHRVTSGENLTAIAERYGIRGGWRTLFNLNRHIIADPNRIYPSQVLRLA